MKARNILLITSDELRSDCLSIAGNPDVKTPNIDALARRGAFFANHFTPFPKCVPARCAMHTGRYCHTDGIRSVSHDNHLKPGTPNLPEFLRQQGFETAVLGLNHVWDSDWFYGKDDETKNQKSAGVVDYTSYTLGPLNDLANQPRIYPEGKARPIPADLEQVDFGGLLTGRIEGDCDENRTDQACLYLEKLRDPSKPFFLQLNLSKPHPPYKIPDPWYSLYDPAKITPFPSALPENASLPLRAQRKWRLGDDIAESSLREIQAVYYSMISYIDDLVGQVLDCLKQQGLEDDTLVIFTSDHGDYAGQYGINEKWDASLQDCLLHVPFIVAGPDVPAGTTISGLTEHVDLPATILDYFGLQPFAEWVWHGESLLPVLAGGQGKPAVFADGGHEASLRRRFNTPTWEEKGGRRRKKTGGKQLTYAECPDSMARCKMVRTHKWKLVIRETGGNELFDVETDPYEMRNLYGDNSYSDIVSDLQLKLLEWCLRTDTDRPFLRTFGA